jgi:hypothetical protein
VDDVGHPALGLRRAPLSRRAVAPNPSGTEPRIVGLPGTHCQGSLSRKKRGREGPAEPPQAPRQMGGAMDLSSATWRSIALERPIIRCA